MINIRTPKDGIPEVLFYKHQVQLHTPCDHLAKPQIAVHPDSKTCQLFFLDLLKFATNCEIILIKYTRLIPETPCQYSRLAAHTEKKYRISILERQEPEVVPPDKLKQNPA